MYLPTCFMRSFEGMAVFNKRLLDKVKQSSSKCKLHTLMRLLHSSGANLAYLCSPMKPKHFPFLTAKKIEDFIFFQQG